MKKGDVVLTPFPFTDLTESKVRPALVLVVSDLDVVIAFITTQTKWRDIGDLDVEPDGLNGLKAPSLIRLSKLATVDKEVILGIMGDLNPESMALINAKLKRIFKLT